MNTKPGAEMPIPEDIQKWIENRMEGWSFETSKFIARKTAQDLYRHLQSKEGKGMRWVKASERIDELNGRLWKLCRINGVAQVPLRIIRKDLIADVAGKTYRAEEIEWLDTESSDPSKEIESLRAERDEMRKALEAIDGCYGDHDEVRTIISNAIAAYPSPQNPKP